MNQIWPALGVDPKTIPNHTTLGELGIESMFAVELQQGLEREYDIKLTLNDIKNITVKQLKNFQSGNKKLLKEVSLEIKALKTSLSKIKFLIPTETHCRLNTVQNGDPIYFLPPTEGIFSLVENLAKKINRPVIGLNWTQDMKNMKSMKEINTYYLNLLKKLSPNGNYDIVGHSFGAMIASKILRKSSIGKAVIIDVLSNTHFEEDVNIDKYLNDSIDELIRSIFLGESLREVVFRNLNKIKDINEKLKILGSQLREFGGKTLTDKDLDEIMENTVERAKVALNYRIKSLKKFKKFNKIIGKKMLKINGNLLIIKPERDLSENNVMEKINESYHMLEKVKVIDFLMKFFL